MLFVSESKLWAAIFNKKQQPRTRFLYACVWGRLVGWKVGGVVARRN